MELGIIGLGRMGMNMAKRLLKFKHKVIVYNRTKEKIKEIAKQGAVPTYSLNELVKKLKKPSILWLMLPAGKITDEYIEKLIYLLKKGDIIIDGSNGYYKDDLKRFEDLKKEGINYLDAGVSGGIWGLKNGYCTMIGGDKNIFKYVEPIVKDLAPKNGYMYCGGPGAGHFVKMIHNAIEYALMEAYAEGFHILKASRYGEKLNLADIAKMWNNGSVIRSWLLELLKDVFKDKNKLSQIKGYVEDSGETRWTINEAIDNGISADTIAISLFKRFDSRQEDIFANKIIAMLRNKFGGHFLLKNKQKVKIKNLSAGKIKHASAERK
jgi:6-phosphogluconate dehydrogenase